MYGPGQGESKEMLVVTHHQPVCETYRDRYRNALGEYRSIAVHPSLQKRLLSGVRAIQGGRERRREIRCIWRRVGYCTPRLRQCCRGRANPGMIEIASSRGLSHLSSPYLRRPPASIVKVASSENRTNAFQTLMTLRLRRGLNRTPRNVGSDPRMRSSVLELAEPPPSIPRGGVPVDG